MKLPLQFHFTLVAAFLAAAVIANGQFPASSPSQSFGPYFSEMTPEQVTDFQKKVRDLGNPKPLAVFLKPFLNEYRRLNPPQYAPGYPKPDPDKILDVGHYGSRRTILFLNALFTPLKSGFCARAIFHFRDGSEEVRYIATNNQKLPLGGPRANNIVLVFDNERSGSLASVDFLILTQDWKNILETTVLDPIP